MSRALELDMADRWIPTQDRYLNHVPKSRLVAVVTEAVSVEAAKAIAAMKKGDAIKAAYAVLSGLRWLPEVLR